MTPELLTVREVAALLRTTEDAIYARVERGRPPAGLFRDGRNIRFRAVDLRRSLGLVEPPPDSAGSASKAT